jgi:RNA polymerase sigma factor (sigma-70 family)
MVRALTKRKEDGTPYTRLPRIEQLLTRVLATDPATLPTRAAISDRTDALYLPPEVLVHLIRHALRMQDPRTASAILPRLGERCAELLKRRVPDSNAFDAADVREDILSALYGLFVDDQWSPADGVLDYYEVHFNHAFSTLRNGIVRKALASSAPLDPLDEPLDGDDDEAPPADFADLSPDADLLQCAQKAELHRMIQALPPDERQAVVWTYLYGLKVESIDPAEKTVAHLCGVSGSEIRSRLRSAYARLKKRMEEKLS